MKINGEEYLDERELSGLLNKSVASLRSDRLKKKGIVYYKFGGCVRYRLSDIEEFINKCRVDFREG